MIYADYTYYTDSYGGRAVNQEDFLRLAAGGFRVPRPCDLRQS